MSFEDQLVSTLLKCLNLEGVILGTLATITLGLTAGGASLLAADSNNSPSPVGIILISCAAAIALFGAWTASKILPEPRMPSGKYARFEVNDSKELSSVPTAPVAPLREELNAKNTQWFIDNEGRRVLLRGVNLGGSTKMPTRPNGASWNKQGFYDVTGKGEMSFVGRPFPLKEADEHLQRLRAWGYTFLRFLITWEAVEHDGPGEYDEDYLEYLKAVIRKCASHGISVFIDPHQDVWSRWTGGDGAPAWTLTKAGFDITKLYASSAALTHQEHGDPFPRMVWMTNYSRLATSTMFTLFFAGNRFAPLCKVDGEPIQEYLQRHYCAAIQRVANVLRDETNVIGFDTLNEPSAGYVGRKDPLDSCKSEALKSGWRMTPLQGFALGAGISQRVPVFTSPFIYGGIEEMNPDGVCAWTDGPGSCVWRKHGVWDVDTGSNGSIVPKPVLKKPLYFQTDPVTGEHVDFLHMHLVPFWRRVAQAVRVEIPDAIIFAEPNVNLSGADAEGDKPVLSENDVGDGGYVWAKHYYDGITLLFKTFRGNFGINLIKMMPVLGRANVIRAHSYVIKSFFGEARRMGDGGSPVLIGEIGIPFDMDNKASFRSGNFARQALAMDTTMRALEDSLVSFTLWNYTADNSNERGDLWNDEDLSIFSRDQRDLNTTDLNSGGRALCSVVRPHAQRVAGVPTKMVFDPYHSKRRFHLRFAHDDDLNTNVTIVFLPRYQYPNGVECSMSDGHVDIDWETQTLRFVHSREEGAKHGHHWITVIAKDSTPDGRELQSTKSHLLNSA